MKKYSYTSLIAKFKTIATIHFTLHFNFWYSNYCEFVSTHPPPQKKKQKKTFSELAKSLDRYKY